MNNTSADSLHIRRALSSEARCTLETIYSTMWAESGGFVAIRAEHGWTPSPVTTADVMAEAWEEIEP